MIEVRQTALFADWLANLRDARAAKRVVERIYRLSLGNAGQHRTLKGGIIELKIDYGPGYRLYCARRGNRLVILLCGGDKSSQATDITTAMSMAKEV